MQPLAYLAVRALLGWIQFVERSERAFLNNPLALVAAGAVHSWAVVYSLFVAVHTRAMRFDGYHEGYIEHLPSSVAWTETIAVASLWIWVLAGFITAAVRILDEDADGLPVGLEDLKGNPITKLVRSPVFHTALGHAHSISCAGLFLSILMLCATMGVMKGGITMCEFCLALVSIGFALPHALVAIRRLSDDVDQVFSEILPQQAAESAAAEAASMGPQLSIILALADAPGHAYAWQNLVYLIAATAFVAAVVACWASPPQAANTALPPEPVETFVCLCLDMIAAVAIVLSYPHLNTWFFWMSCLILVGVAAAVQLREVREFYIDWLEPLLVVRSDTHKKMPGQQRQTMKRNAWVVALVCASTALWDIVLHPAPEVLNSAALARASAAPLPSTLMLRWLPSSEQKEAKEMLPMISEALRLDANNLEVQETFPEHRLMLFKYKGTERNETNSPVYLDWQAAMWAPTGKLAEVADNKFPAALNLSACSEVQNVLEQSAAAEKQLDEVGLSSKDEARAAYVAACDWFKHRIVYGEGEEKKPSPKF